MGVSNFSFLFNMIVGIYKITSPKGRVYIGQSSNVLHRWETYKKVLCKGQPRLYMSLLKYGTENHTFEVIEECSIEQLNERERYWQEFYDVIGRNGLNCKLTKTEDKSGKNSEEVKEKISVTMKKMGYRPPSREGVQGYWKGKTKPVEANLKTSVKLKGIIRGPKSEESKSLQRQSMSEKVPWNKGKKYTQTIQRKGRKIINILTGIVYDSIKQASLVEQVSRDTVTYSCKKLQSPFRYYA